MRSFTLAELASVIGAELKGDGAITVTAIATIQAAVEGQVAFLANSKYKKFLETTGASAVVVSPQEADSCPVAALIINNPYVAYAKLAQYMDNTPASACGIHPSAVIADGVVLGKNVAIGANAVIETGVELGDDVQIGAGCVVGQYSQIGARSKLWANVTVYHGVSIGEDCLFQSGAIIGSDGFGYANEAGKWLKIPQVGGVVIGNGCEIGASTTIDRGALGDTILGTNVIIDNQCQIAHNVVIGDYTAIAGCTVIAGSTTIGKYCTIAGKVAINGHCEIVDKVHITGFTMVTKSLTEPGVYSSGMPVSTNQEWRKNISRLRHLDDMYKRIRALEKQQSTDEA